MRRWPNTWPPNDLRPPKFTKSINPSTMVFITTLSEVVVCSSWRVFDGPSIVHAVLALVGHGPCCPRRLAFFSLGQRRFCRAVRAGLARLHPNQAGGAAKSSDKGSIFVLRANGTVDSAQQGWIPFVSGLYGSRALPGDAIYVPEDFERVSLLKTLVDVSQVFYQIGLGAAAIKGIAPSIGIARVGVISIGAYFIGPSLVGLLSDAITLPWAMMYPALALVIAGYLAKTLKN